MKVKFLQWPKRPYKHTHTYTHTHTFPPCLLSSFSPVAAAAAAKLLQSCPTLCDLIDGSPPGSPVPGILQARTLEWVAISFSNAWKWKVKVKSLSRVWLLATPWTAAYQAPPSMGFSRQEYWSGVPLPSPSPQLLVTISILFSYQAYRHQGLCNCPFVLDFSFSRKLRDRLTHLQAAGLTSLFPDVFHPVSIITAPYVPSILLCFIPPPALSPPDVWFIPLFCLLFIASLESQCYEGKTFCLIFSLFSHNSSHHVSPGHSGNICWISQ